MSSDTVQDATRPLRPSLGRIVRRWVYMVGAAIVLWVVVGSLFELIWPSGASFDWRENAIMGAIFGTAMEAAYVAVEFRYGRGAVTDQRHPMRRRAGWLFASVLGGLSFVLVTVWNLISK